LDFPHKPEVLGIAVIDFDKNDRAYFVDLTTLGLSEDTKSILQNDLSLENFIEKTVCRYVNWNLRCYLIMRTNEKN